MMGAWCERKSEGRDTWRRGLNKAGLMFMVSKDEGKTWQTRSVLYEGRTFPYQLCEPSWIISSGGHFRVFTREDLGFGPGVEFLSKDQGKTWESSPMRFMGHHIFADFLPDGKGVLASFRVAHYIHMPAVGMWWDDGSKWGKFLHLDNIFTNERYHADVSQWIDLGHGTYMVAYSLPPRPGSEVRVKVARFRLDQFIAPGVCGASK
jgi:hypothetical protein